MNVTIPRAEWLRGEGPSTSSLYRPTDGKSCCLGHVLLAAGFTKDELTFTTPGRVANNPGNSKPVPEGLAELHHAYYVDTSRCHALMSTNDTVTLEDADREERIATMLAPLDIEVTFV